MTTTASVANTFTIATITSTDTIVATVITSARFTASNTLMALEVMVNVVIVVARVVTVW